MLEAAIRHELGLAQKQEDLDNEARGIAPNQTRVIPFPCLPLQDNKDFECKCTQKGGRFKKAVLPKLYEWRGQSFIQYVGNTDMDISFVPARSIQDLNATQGSIPRPMYFISGNNIYVSLPPKFANMCEVTVMAIPDNPTETNGMCFDVWTSSWNVSEYMKAIVKQRVLQIYAPTLVQTNQNRDMRNNANDGNQFVTTQTA